MSEDVLSLLLNSWSDGTKKQYSPHISRWFSYCKENYHDPFTASVFIGAEFLVKYYRTSKVEYSAMNTARSALSAIIKPVHGVTFGKHPIIQRLLKGIFKETPSLPKYTVTYDVKQIFDYFKSLGDIGSQPLEMISKCTATLLCLLSGQRSQTMGALSLDFMFFDNTRESFYIPTLLKQSRPKFSSTTSRVLYVSC